MFSGDSKENRFSADKDEYGADTMSEIHIIGRITLNLWRVMKTEVSVSPAHLLEQGFPTLVLRDPLSCMFEMFPCSNTPDSNEWVVI